MENPGRFNFLAEGEAKRVIILLKLALLFTLVVVLIRIKVPLGISLILGSLGVALAFQMSPGDTAEAFAKMTVSAETLKFVGLVGLVHMLSLILKAGGQIERITLRLQGFIPYRRFLVASLPAIVGLLPMPGGALFSAPMVEAATGKTDLSGDHKTQANHWFRHIWEYTWPLYPGLIIAADLLNVRVGYLSLLHSPLTLVAVLVGIVFLLRKIPAGRTEEKEASMSRLGSGSRFFLEMAPFLIVVVVHILLEVTLLLALGIGIAWALGFNLLKRAAPPAAYPKAVFLNLAFWGFLVMAFGVKFFGGMLGESGALADLGTFFGEANISPILLVILLPFVTGLISGITIVYVSTTFPVLLAVPAVAQNPIPFMVLAFCAGFLGTLLSPIHACLVLGCAYFKGSLPRNIAVLAAPTALILATGIALYFAYAWLLPATPVGSGP
ncbi:MAG: DUF401 family protein [Planctomycetota bacterium]